MTETEQHYTYPVELTTSKYVSLIGAMIEYAYFVQSGCSSLPEEDEGEGRSGTRGCGRKGHVERSNELPAENPQFEKCGPIKTNTDAAHTCFSSDILEKQQRPVGTGTSRAAHASATQHPTNETMVHVHY